MVTSFRQFVHYDNIRKREYPGNVNLIKTSTEEEDLGKKHFT